MSKPANERTKTLNPDDKTTHWSKAGVFFCCLMQRLRRLSFGVLHFFGGVYDCNMEQEDKVI